MRLSFRTPAALAAASLLTIQAIPAPAEAAPALVAPGAPMRVFPQDPPKTIDLPNGEKLTMPREGWVGTCSQGPSGTLNLPGKEPQRVMLTVSHCVNTMPGFPEITNELYAPVGTEYKRIGERVASNHVAAEAMNLSAPMESIRTADWGVVRIDEGVTETGLSHSREFNGGVQGEPVKITHVRDFRTLAPGEVAVDNFGQPICKDGATTGRTCATQIGRTRNGIYSWGLNYVQGDSGGVNFDPRDGAAVGVSSMTLGPLGKAQPVDRILEDAYGIPDGQVNEAFTVTDSTAPRENFTTSGEEEERVSAEIERLNRDLKPPVPRDELRKAVDNAQQEAAGLVEKASQGQFDPAEINRAIGYHSDRIGYWGGASIGEEIGKRL